MAAGLGFKTFTTGEVLTAADTNGYLMQGVLVFADATARDAAITSPQEGQFAYLKDTNVTTYYTGSAWANLDTTGMTNPMTTTGDTIYSSSGSTPARLGIGTTGQVLTVAGGVPSWATSTSGGMTLLSTTTLSGATTTISSINQGYNTLYAVIFGVTNATADGILECKPNNASLAHIISTATRTAISSQDVVPILISYNQNLLRTNAENSWVLQIHNYASTTSRKPFTVNGGFIVTSGALNANMASGHVASTTAVTSLVFSQTGGNLSPGTVLLYGVK